jgi:hypothetical protein
MGRIDDGFCLDWELGLRIMVPRAGRCAGRDTAGGESKKKKRHELALLCDAVFRPGYRDSRFISPSYQLGLGCLKNQTDVGLTVKFFYLSCGIGNIGRTTAAKWAPRYATPKNHQHPPSSFHFSSPKPRSFASWYLKSERTYHDHTPSPRSRTRH